MPKQKETRFKEKVLPILKLLPNTWVIKTQMVAILGIPDLIGCCNGRFFALELKNSRKDAERAHGRARLQAYVILKIRDAGGIAEFCYPENWEEIHARLSILSQSSRALYP